MKNIRKKRNKIKIQNRTNTILRYAGKLLIFWLAVGGLFAMVRMSTFVLAENAAATQQTTGAVTEQSTAAAAEQTTAVTEQTTAVTEETTAATEETGTIGVPAVLQIIPSQSEIVLLADDAANTSAQQLEDYLRNQITLTAVYEDGTQVQVSKENVAFSLSEGEWDVKGSTDTGYVYTVSIAESSVTCEVLVEVKNNTQANAPIEDQINVPAAVPEKNDISDKLQVSIEGWTYGETAKIPTGKSDTGITIDSALFIYSYDGTAEDGSILIASPVPPVKAGNYQVTARYEDDSQTGLVKADFLIRKKTITPFFEAAGIQKSFDFTTKIVGTMPIIQFADKIREDSVTAQADFNYDDMEIGDNKRLTASHILLDASNTVNTNYELSADTAFADGASVRAVRNAAEMNRAIIHLNEMIVDANNLTVPEKELVAKAVEQLQQLSKAEKSALDIKTVLKLDTLQKQILGNLVNVQVATVDGSIPSPAGIVIQGATLAAEAANAADRIDIDITPQKSGDSSVKMELLLTMQKNGVVQALQSPLLFTMKLPSSINIERLIIKHIMANSTETVTYSNLGNQQISFQLSSFSTLQFLEKEVPPESAESSESSGSSGSSKKKKPHKETEEDKEYDHWQSVKRKLRKAKDGASLTMDALNYKEMPWYIMDVLRDRKTITLVVQWKGGKTFTIPAGKAQPSDEKMVYWPLTYLEKIYNKEEIPPIINQQVPEVEIPKVDQKPIGPNKKPVTPSKKIQETIESTVEESTLEEENTAETNSSESEAESESVTEVFARGEEVHQVESFCLIDLLTGGRTKLGCYWCFIPIIIVLSMLGIVFIFVQEKSQKREKE